MTSYEVSDEAVRELLAEDDDVLFAQLVPAAEREELYSFEGVSARGREIFRGAFTQVRGTVCPVYRRHSASLGDEVQLVALVVGSIVGQVSLGGIPVVPFAALAVKIGLTKLCASWEPEEG